MTRCLGLIRVLQSNLVLSVNAPHCLALRDVGTERRGGTIIFLAGGLRGTFETGEVNYFAVNYFALKHKVSYKKTCFTHILCFTDIIMSRKISFFFKKRPREDEEDR